MESGFKKKAEQSRIKLETKLCKLLKNEGINFATGVPCGVQKYIIANLSSDPEILHTPATRESEAIGIAAGASLANKKPVVYMQNSGLLNCLNDLTSLTIAYQIPMILIVSWRGASGEDAPQHLVNGQATIKILDNIGIPVQILTKENMKSVVFSSVRLAEKRQSPVVILIIRGVLK